MDVTFLYQGQLFTWDPEKASVNLQKHGVAFEQACEVFFDPFVRVFDASSPDEQRDVAVGLTEDWILLVVVHILRQEEAIRIISARPATNQERREYEGE
jgi:uncharacterized DUF497 family protein